MQFCCGGEDRMGSVTNVDSVYLLTVWRQLTASNKPSVIKRNFHYEKLKTTVGIFHRNAYTNVICKYSETARDQLSFPLQKGPAYYRHFKYGSSEIQTLKIFFR